MADEETVVKPKRAYTRRSRDGETSVDSVGEGEKLPPEAEGIAGKPLLTWAEFDKWLYKWEWDNKEKRVTLIYSNLEDAPSRYSGCYSECDVNHGSPAIRLSSGEILKV